MARFQSHPEYWVDNPGVLGRATLAVTITLGLGSILTVAARIYIRFVTRMLRMDDYLMATGCLLYITCCSFVCLDVYSGLGTLDTQLPDPSPGHTWNNVMGTKWLAFFQYMYCWTLPFIKTSIGMSLAEITIQRRYRYPIFVIIVASVLSTLVGFILLMTICKPVEKTWLGDLVEGTCTSAQLYSTFSYIVSIVTVITDWGFAIIPAFVIWGLNMRRSLKISAYILVVFGSIASISTLVRLPYLVAYTATTDALYHKANIVVWSMVEMGVGIIAGSIPALSKLLVRCLAIPNQGQMQPQNYSTKRYHFKPRIRQSSSGTRPLDSAMTTQDIALGPWTELTDGGSQEHVIVDNSKASGLEAQKHKSSHG